MFIDKYQFINKRKVLKKINTNQKQSNLININLLQKLIQAYIYKKKNKTPNNSSYRVQIIFVPFYKNHIIKKAYSSE